MENLNTLPRTIEEIDITRFDEDFLYDPNPEILAEKIDALLSLMKQIETKLKENFLHNLDYSQNQKLENLNYCSCHLTRIKETSLSSNYKKEYYQRILKEIKNFIIEYQALEQSHPVHENSSNITNSIQKVTRN
ncbi:hypothetical protein CSB37_01725 [bacterium DOLZORAL124_38_8]|nr:MAG: hypothetical protein CSB37_01725 [bacterium DOLZORAL124_38_8]